MCGGKTHLRNRKSSAPHLSRNARVTDIRRNFTLDHHLRRELCRAVFPSALAVSCELLARFCRRNAALLVCFARKSLADAGYHVYSAVKQSLEEGRKAIAWYVGRDTAELSEEGVIKAAVETVAENLTDGVVSPLVFMLIGGAPLGMLYKAVNTLDSMVGYHNDKYEYFGKFSAKMDDLFNFIPARLSALCMIAGAGMLHLDNRNALRIYRRDRSKHKSPNAGQTESVCAGALHIQLGGDASYFGKIVKKAAFGDPMRRVDRTDILAAVDLMTAASVFALVLCCAIRLIVKS